MIHLAIPGLPPTTNHAYTHILKSAGHGKAKTTIPIRTLSTAGKKYKRETSAYLVRTYPTEMRIFKPDTPYGYWVQFHFPELLNKGWPKEAKSRYKKLDVSNRVKLFEDALFDASGIDDSQVMQGTPEKVAGPEYTHIWVWNMEEECPVQWRV
jgi:hypothetical protein